MGLAASQCRLLTLTSRANDLELTCMTLSAKTIRNAQKSYQLLVDHNAQLDELDEQSKDKNSEYYIGYRDPQTSGANSPSGSGSPQGSGNNNNGYGNNFGNFDPKMYETTPFDTKFVKNSGYSIEHKNYMSEDGSTVRTEDAVNADIKKIDDADAASQKEIDALDKDDAASQDEIDKLDAADVTSQAAINESKDNQKALEQQSEDWEAEKASYYEGIEEGKKDIAKFENETIPEAEADLTSKQGTLDTQRSEATTLESELNDLNNAVTQYDTVTIPSLNSTYTQKYNAYVTAQIDLGTAKEKRNQMVAEGVSSDQLMSYDYNVMIPKEQAATNARYDAGYAKQNLDRAKEERAEKARQAQEKQNALNNKNNEIAQSEREVSKATSKLDGYKNALETLKDTTGEKEEHYNQVYSENPYTQQIADEVATQNEEQGKIDANVGKRAEYQGKITANATQRTTLNAKIEANKPSRAKLQDELEKIQNKKKNGYTEDEKKMMDDVNSNPTAFLNALKNGDIAIVDANGNKISYETLKDGLDKENQKKRDDLYDHFFNPNNNGNGSNPSGSNPSGSNPSSPSSDKPQKDKDRYNQKKDQLERDYDAAEKELSLSDKKIQMQQQQVQTELNAVNQEIDSVKSLIEKNIEKGFSYGYNA